MFTKPKLTVERRLTGKPNVTFLFLNYGKSDHEMAIEWDGKIDADAAVKLVEFLQRHAEEGGRYNPWILKR